METTVLDSYILNAEKAFEEQEYIKGKGQLEKALAIEPNFGKAHNHLGWLYIYHLKDWEKAEQHLRYAIKCSPKLDSPYMHLSHILFENARFDEMSEILEKGEKIKAFDKCFYYNELGRLHEAKGMFRTAIKHYKEAIKYSFSDKEFKTVKNNMKRCRYKRWILWF